MKNIIILIIVYTLRIIFSYGVVLLFELTLNPLNWTLTGRIWFLVIALLLTSGEFKIR